jgi:hypothetical protein
MTFVSKYCKGELCRQCGEDAAHKIGEEIPDDDPFKDRHNLTVYVCEKCFSRIMDRSYFIGGGK